MTGKFIVFEGIDGSGKTTCLETVADYLHSCHIPYIKTGEPNETYGMRAIIKHELVRQEINDPLAELFMFSLDRQLHLISEIKPALMKGLNVLCDRYIDSTRVYQGYLQGLSLKYVKVVQSAFISPDLTLLFDLPAELGMKRIGDRATKKEKFENIRLLERAREAYLKIASASPKKYRILDATKPKARLARQAIKAIEEVLNL
jgi:dTMP kinase